MDVLKFTYRKTNYYLLRGNQNNTVAFDAGWPGTYFEYARAMKVTGTKVSQVNYVVVSHFHPDHAGLLGEMIKNGITCVVFKNQINRIDEMEEMILRHQKNYISIDKENIWR
jgi:glyoxylase-like metal-dependent hydrolase (beta-lactamase superfamily II)